MVERQFPVGIAGAGRVAQALGRLLRERGEPIVAVASRDPRRAETAAQFIGGDVEPVSYTELPSRAIRILIAVPDRAITPVAGLLSAARIHPNIAIHTCGSRGPEALDPLLKEGTSCAMLHPLQTVATPQQGAADLPFATFAIAGQEEASLWAQQNVRTLNGYCLNIPSDRVAIYHAAAVMASNYLVTLIGASVTMMKSAGVEEEDALRALGPLVRASTANALELGPLKALTGPIERGDVSTIAGHLEAMTGVSAHIGELYRAAGLATLELAQQRELPEGAAQSIGKILRESGRGNG